MSVSIYKASYEWIAGGREFAEFLADHLYQLETSTEYRLPSDLEEAEEDGILTDCPEKFLDELKELIEKYAGESIIIDW